MGSAVQNSLKAPAVKERAGRAMAQATFAKVSKTVGTRTHVLAFPGGFVLRFQYLRLIVRCCVHVSVLSLCGCLSICLSHNTQHGTDRQTDGLSLSTCQWLYGAKQRFSFFCTHETPLKFNVIFLTFDVGRFD